MSELIKTTPAICKRCKYSMRFGSQPKDQTATNNNIACDYLSITLQCRVLDHHGDAAYDPAYCDKFEKRKRGKSNGNSKDG